MKRKYILLSGGIGSRTYPLSKFEHPKQFLKVYKTGESMMQRMYNLIKENDKDSDIIVATSVYYVEEVKKQLGEDVVISIEPSRRNTFPAIILASAYIEKISNDNDYAVIVCPVDNDVDAKFINTLIEGSKLLNDNSLVLIGTKPTYPSTQYGYILADFSFVEKPTNDLANKIINDGALWNCGVFIYSNKYIKSKTQELIGTNIYDELFDRYNQLEKISFDYKVVEKEKHIKVIENKGKWRDLGNIDLLNEYLKENNIDINNL